MSLTGGLPAWGEGAGKSASGGGVARAPDRLVGASRRRGGSIPPVWGEWPGGGFGGYSTWRARPTSGVYVEWLFLGSLDMEGHVFGLEDRWSAGVERLCLCVSARQESVPEELARVCVSVLEFPSRVTSFLKENWGCSLPVDTRVYCRAGERLRAVWERGVMAVSRTV